MKMKKILRMPLRRIPGRTPPTESLHAKAAANAETYDNEEYEAEEEPNMKFSHALMVVLALHIIAVGGIFAFNSIKAGQSSSTKASAKDENARSAAQTAQSKPSSAERANEKRTGKTHTVQAGETLSRIASLYKISVEAIEKENGITTYSMIRVGQALKIPAQENLAVKPDAAKPATDPATAAAKHAFLAAKTDMTKATAPASNPDTAKPAPPLTKADIPKPAALGKTDVEKPPAVAATTPKPANAQPSPKKTDTPASADADVYVVAKGDNPYNIAKKLHVSYSELIAINEIKDPTRVQIGQKLKIPAKRN